MSEWKAPKRRSQVEQIIFLATHTLKDVEPPLLRRYQKELAETVNAGRARPRAEIWVLLYQPKDRSKVAYFDLTASTELRAQIAVWGDLARDHALPEMKKALDNHWGFQHPNETYLKTYFYQHTGLFLWFCEFRGAYPALKFIWRMEPDVMVSDTLGSLLIRSARDQISDVLLPKLSSRSQAPLYGCSKQRFRIGEKYGEELHLRTSGQESPCTTHWTLNTPILHLTRHGEQPVFTIVPVGRFSVRFITETMPKFWHNGTVGYEEMLLPMVCKYSDECNLGHFNDYTSVSAEAVLFRPIWPCLFFLKALVRPPPALKKPKSHHRTNKYAAHQTPKPMLFHPVKNRSCVFDYWAGGPVPKDALNASEYLPRTSAEKVSVTKLAEMVNKLGLGGDDYD